MDAATEAKTAVEDAQRELAKRREERNEGFVPRFFELKDGLWKAKFLYVYQNRLTVHLITVSS